MSLPVVTGEFRVVADPELRFAPSGTAVGTIRLVANSRKKVGEDWVDDKVVWLRGTAFNRVAENIVESVSKGDLVVVTGRLQTEEWEKDGEKKSATALVIDTIGPSLAFSTAKVQRVERTSAPASRPAAVATTVEDPWAGGGDEPPF